MYIPQAQSQRYHSRVETRGAGVSNALPLNLHAKFKEEPEKSAIKMNNIF